MWIIAQHGNGMLLCSLIIGTYSLRCPSPSTSSSSSTCPQTGFSTIGNISGKSNAPSTSKCQIELDIPWDKLVSHATEGEWQKIAPLRILSFDIECLGRKGIFPEPEKDAVIQIANMVVRQGEKEPFIKNVFTLDDCAPIVGSEVISFEKKKGEVELLKVQWFVCIIHVWQSHVEINCCSYLGYTFWNSCGNIIFSTLNLDTKQRKVDVHKYIQEIWFLNFSYKKNDRNFI